ncbi:hypothetical protein HBA53_23260 (plasmid) [Rhodococcus pyridinivorans]|nr:MULTISPECIES: tachylectin-related carbohydrate-binding protein [Rhodococcus]MBX4171228.1 hypothetical protein [Rhodococcus sp. DMU2021]QXF84040.1 hypothetical protein HBA53_23260 [Rhodococcus pyridinivorans]
MPSDDEEFLSVVESVPYVEYIAKAFSILEGIYNFGKESKEDRALRELQERVADLERYINSIDDRVSHLEHRVSQGDNRERLRNINTHQLSIKKLSRDLQGHPEDAVNIAESAFDHLRVMYEDRDLWLWDEAVRKPTEASKDWRPLPPSFKGLPLPVFGLGTMVWALAAQAAIKAGVPRPTFSSSASALLGWVSTRREWVPGEVPPQTIAEHFRFGIQLEILMSTYPNKKGYCEYSFVAVNHIDRTRTHIRDLDIDYRDYPTAMCTADPRLAVNDEAILEEESPQIKTLRILEESVTRIRDRGSLADPVYGQFADWFYADLTLYGIDASGELRGYQIKTTTAVAEPPEVVQIGDVLGVGWQHFSEVLGTYGNIVYALSEDGSVQWYREDDISKGPQGWTGPRTVKRPRASRLIIVRGEYRTHVNGGGGTIYQIHQTNLFRLERTLKVMFHADVKGGDGEFGNLTTISENWPDYVTVFGGSNGVIYGIDQSGDLFWHRHKNSPDPEGKVEGPTKIGTGWHGFTSVFAFGDGFIAGVYPNGEMLLYNFRQWRDGPGEKTPSWRGPAQVPGVHWRSFNTFIPMVGDRPPKGPH